MFEDEGRNRGAYRAIKALVTSGALKAGVRLDPEKLRAITDASLTTTYNALRCLVVERLIDGSPTSGFHMPALTEAGLRGRYAWACDVAMMSVRAAAPAIEPVGADRAGDDADAQTGVVASTERLFARIASLPEIVEYQMAMVQANDRLRPLRRYEPVLLEGLDAELETLRVLARERNVEAISAALLRYRDRRLPLAGELLRRLGGGSETPFP